MGRSPVACGGGRTSCRAATGAPRCSAGVDGPETFYDGAGRYLRIADDGSRGARAPHRPLDPIDGQYHWRGMVFGALPDDVLKRPEALLTANGRTAAARLTERHAAGWLLGDGCGLAAVRPDVRPDRATVRPPLPRCPSQRGTRTPAHESASSTPATSSASRGAPRKPLPRRSTTRPASTPCHGRRPPTITCPVRKAIARAMSGRARIGRRADRRPAWSRAALGHPLDDADDGGGAPARRSDRSGAWVEQLAGGVLQEGHRREHADVPGQPGLRHTAHCGARFAPQN